MAVSIKDIARLAGVSHSTVSRALNRSPLIPLETAERIQKIAKEQGYTASAVARSLVTRKTEAIGVVVTSIADPFNGEVVAGIEEVANREGYSVVLATSQADPQREMTVVRSFRERRVDGILVASSRLGAQYQELFDELEAPIVLLNNQHPSEMAHSVNIDNLDGGYQATAHLLALGHKDIAYIGDESGLHSDEERLGGFQAAMKHAQVTIRQDLVVRGNGKQPLGRVRAAELLALSQPPTAIFCYNDMTALGVIEEVHAKGWRIGREVSVVGFDDLFFTASLQPPLTTFRQPKHELGKQAMQLLLAILRGQEAERKVVVRGKLIVRGSTGKPYQAILSGKNLAARS
jgi:DNA-binding LacI/PurR family transcriptional regulator